MPLRIVARKGNHTLYLRGTVRGQSVYESTGTSDRRLAEELRAHRERELFERAIYGARAVVSFAEAAASYLDAEDRSPATGRAVARILTHFGTAKLADIDQVAIDRAYRALLAPTAANATRLRMVLTPIKAILEHAARRGWCSRPAFETPQQTKVATHFLRPADATALVQAAAPHLRPLLVFLVGTGCRMSEALDLDWRTVDLAGARAVVWQKQQTHRHVDLAPVVLAALSALPAREGRVFLPPPFKKGDQTFQRAHYHDTGRQGGGQIKTGFASAVRRAGLDAEITPHDLRHTWASWHYAAHRDLLRLKHDGGWASVAMVERYAHLMPGAYAAEAAAWWGGGAAPVQAAIA
jgi:integrase